VGPMLGVNTHGAYAEFIRVPQNLVFKIPNSLDFRKAAYTEPVAASLAVLEAPIKKNQKGIIIGSSRIATLTHRLMRLSGFRSVRIVTPLALRAIPDNSCDFAIETLVNEEIFAEMVRIVKPKGVIVLKSRQHIPAPLSVAAVVKKDLTLRGTHYGSFKKAIALMAENAVKVDDILGPVLSLEEGVRILQSGGWEQGNRKIFFTAHS
ncbi:MAG: L-threonine 3-dehydrogenase, partial [bacterium]|nr:L-threonine 3-dehydrogenase [bacterium]